MDVRWGGCGGVWKPGGGRPRPTEHHPSPPEQGLIKKAATKITFAPIPSSFPTSSRADFSTRSPDVEKAPPFGHGAAHPALGVPKFRCCAPPATPSLPRVLARPQIPPTRTSSGPSSFCHWSSSTSRPAPYPIAEPPHTTPLPRPHAGHRPHAPTRPPSGWGRPTWRRLPLALSHLPPAGSRPGCLQSPLTFHPRTPSLSPAPPGARSFLKRKEHQPAITENRELKSPP